MSQPVRSNARGLWQRVALLIALAAVLSACAPSARTTEPIDPVIAAAERSRADSLATIPPEALTAEDYAWLVAYTDRLDGGASGSGRGLLLIVLGGAAVALTVTFLATAPNR